MRGLITSLIVLGIVVFLGGLGLCFIGKVRGAAARMSCQNNLKQVALSVDNYHDSQGHYPRGTVPHSTLPPERRLSWMPDILPFMECMPRLALDRNEAWDVEPNRDPRFLALDLETKQLAPDGLGERFGLYKQFLCPANWEHERPGLAAFTHYVGMAGVGANAAALSEHDPKVGFFGYDRMTRKADVTDGLEYSILLAETATEVGPWIAGGPATVRGLDPRCLPYVGRAAPFSSRHSGELVNIAWGDGSVRAVAPSIPRDVLESLITIHGNEVAPGR
jgi:prepilin-type processing-associated H-X9-DG protein